VSSYSTAQRLQVGSPGGAGRREGEKPEAMLRRALADRIEDKLGDLLVRAESLLAENRAQVLALAHALEIHRTLTGDDVDAVIEGREGETVDGSAYRDASSRRGWRTTTPPPSAPTAGTAGCRSRCR